MKNRGRRLQNIQINKTLMFRPKYFIVRCLNCDSRHENMKFRTKSFR